MVGIDDGTGIRNISPLSSYDQKTLEDLKQEIEERLDILYQQKA